MSKSDPENSRSDALMASLGTLTEVETGTMMNQQADDVAGEAVASALADEAPTPQTVYRKQRNSTWRILEEQRMHALEIAEECDGAIKLLLTKRDDALAAATVCETAQRGLEV